MSAGERQIFGKTRIKGINSAPGNFGCLDLCQFDTSADDWSAQVNLFPMAADSLIRYLRDKAVVRDKGNVFRLFFQCPNAQSDDGFSRAAAKLTHLLAV